MMPEDVHRDGVGGIENHSTRQKSRENIYEYRDTPTSLVERHISGGRAPSSSRPPSSAATTCPARSASQGSLGTSSSAVSLKDCVTSSPNPTETNRKMAGTPVMGSKKGQSRSRTQLVQGVPQTEV